MTRCAFVIPGDIGLPTGGYAYDRRVLALLPACGIEVAHVAIPGSFPEPTPADLAATEAALAALPADCVLLFDGLAYGALPEALIARIRQRIVALCHHPLALETGIAPARAEALRALETAALARAAHVVVSSPMTRATLAADFGVPAAKVTVAEPGTDRAARVAPWRGGPVSLLAVGSVIPRKGYGILVDALAGLGADARQWQLTIAGSTELDATEVARVRAAIAERGLGDRIALLGAVETARLDALYARAHIFVMPSLYEGYGMVLAEAMARGLPMVTTTGGAAAETVPDGAAIKVPPGDAAALAAGLSRLICSPRLRSELAERSFAAGQTLPGWDETTRIVAGVLARAGSRQTLSACQEGSTP